MAFIASFTRISSCVALIALAALSSEGLASAAVLTFDNQGNHPGGTFTWDSTSARLANGVIDRVSNGSTAMVTGTCGGGFGCISFETGSRVAVFDSSAQELSIYDGGGFLTITGDVSAAGAAGTLYTTTLGFVGNVAVQVNKLPGADGQRLISVSGSLGTGVLDPMLAAYFGTALTTLNGTDAHTAIVLTFNDGQNFGTGAAQTNSVLVTANNAVPEPASVMLLGGGLVSLALLGRRRLQKS